MISMKRSVVIFFVLFLLSSCSHLGNKIVYRDIVVTNIDSVERIIIFKPTSDNYTGKYFELSVRPSETITKKITGPYLVESTNNFRYSVKETKNNCYVIQPITAETTEYHILNKLSEEVTLKDNTYPDWSITIPSHSTVSKEAALYKDEIHKWYIEGYQTENSFTYIIKGSEKVFFTLSVSGNKIIIQ